MVFAADREELVGGFGGIRVDRGLVAGIHFGHESVVGMLEILRPRALPVARQRRGAVHHAIEYVELVRHLMHGNAAAGFGVVDIGLHVGPGQDQRPGVPGLADEVLILDVQHTGSVDVIALHAERIRIDDQLRPAVQALRAELEQRQAAQRGQRTALIRIERQAVDRRDGLAMQELRAQRGEAGVAYGVERRSPWYGRADAAPLRGIDGRIGSGEEPAEPAQARRGPVGMRLSGRSAGHTGRTDQRNMPGRNRCQRGARTGGVPLLRAAGGVLLVAGTALRFAAAGLIAGAVSASSVAATISGHSAESPLALDRGDVRAATGRLARASARVVNRTRRERRMTTSIEWGGPRQDPDYSADVTGLERPSGERRPAALQHPARRSCGRLAT